MFLSGQYLYPQLWAGLHLSQVRHHIPVEGLVNISKRIPSKDKIMILDFIFDQVCVTRDEFIHPCFLTQIMKYKVNFKRKHLVENARIQKFKYDILGDFQTLCLCCYQRYQLHNCDQTDLFHNAIWPFLGS